MSDDELRRKVEYYRRHLDDLAAQRIVIEHQQWTHRLQLRQRDQGFQLLSGLARWFGADAEPDRLFRMAVAAINSALEMDRTIILVPTTEGAGYVAGYKAGFQSTDLERFGDAPLAVPTAVIDGEPLLVTRATPRSPFVAEVTSRLALDSFGMVAIRGDRGVLGVILTGRLAGHTSLYRAYDEADLDTLRAIAGVAQAILQNRRIARLEETERLKAEFYADVAHEFRTPLTLTLGPLAQILEGKWGRVPEGVRQRLDVVARNQRRLLDLINEMLELARVDAGAAELRLETVSDVNELVQECVAHFRAAAEGRGIALDLDVDPTLASRPLLLDRPKLERAIFNLLSNALKFTNAGRIDVRTQGSGDLLTIAVGDTGRGIADEDLPHVFDRFRRASNAGQPHAPSSGIGLALVKEMVDLHGGRVSVASVVDRGTRFTLAIPLRDAPHGTEEPAGRVSLLPPEDPSSGTGQLETDPEASNRAVEAAFDADKPIVLYVEDDPDLRAYVRDSLQAFYNVFLAADGRDGLEAARRYRPDAIVTDQSMPNLDGHGLLRALRADPDLSGLPVIFLTAQHGVDGRIAGLDAGADDYVSKPFHEAELRARIGSTIRARAVERDLATANRRLQMQVRDQMAELVRAGELERYLPREVLAALRRGQDTARPGGRRAVVVLVTDLEVLQSVGERLDERAVGAIIDDHLAQLHAICGAHGGVVDGLGTGRLSVLFGAFSDVAPEDAALAAVETAVELRDAGRRLAAELQRRGLRAGHRHGIGLAAGRAVVGAFGGETARAFAALSEATARASALHAASGEGAIFCDGNVRDVLAARILAREASVDDVVGHEVIGVRAGATTPLDPAPLVERLVSEGPRERELRREGEYWTVSYQGRVFRIRNAKGVEYLAHLLTRPHRQLHVLDLVTHAGGGAPTSDPPGAITDDVRATGEHELRIPMLDGRARQAYRARIEALQERAEEARHHGDEARAHLAEVELHAIAEELAAATGIGGRDRNASTAAERVRINVTRAIKSALQRIAAAQPDLGHHLTAAVRTGMFCSYAPPPGTPDTWRVSG